MRAEFCIFESNAPGLKANFYEPYVDKPSPDPIDPTVCAGPEWLIQKKKNSDPFPGILQWGAAFWPTTWLLNGGNFCRVRITVTF